MSSTNITSFKTSAGDGYVDADGYYIGGVRVTSSAVQLSQYTLTAQMADAGTAQSIYVTAPHAGTIAKIYAVNSVANATTKTVLSAKIATVGVTMPALEITVTQAAGVVSSSVPTAANAVTAGQAIELITDGGTDASMPLTWSVLITR